jgi:hypothetical protein
MRATERLYELWNLPPSGVERFNNGFMWALVTTSKINPKMINSK